MVRDRMIELIREVVNSIREWSKGHVSYLAMERLLRRWEAMPGDIIELESKDQEVAKGWVRSRSFTFATRFMDNVLEDKRLLNTYGAPEEIIKDVNELIYLMYQYRKEMIAKEGGAEGLWSLNDRQIERLVNEYIAHNSCCGKPQFLNVQIDSDFLRRFDRRRWFEIVDGLKERYGRCPYCDAIVGREDADEHIARHEGGTK